jgi:hypothetical protein
MWTTPHRRGRRTPAMETKRTLAEREPATLNEVSAPDPPRTHHRLVELLTTAMVVMRDARRPVKGSRADAAGGAIPPMRCEHPAQPGPKTECSRERSTISVVTVGRGFAGSTWSLAAEDTGYKRTDPLDALRER